MQDGQIKQSGNYEDLLTAGTAFEQLVNAHKEVITGLEPSPSENNSELQITVNIHQSMEDINKSEGKLINGLPGVQLTEEEEKAVDNVGWKPFLDYVVISEGLWFSSFCVLSQASFVALQAAASYWLAFGIQIPNVTTVMLISVYTLLSALSTIFVFFRSFFATLLGLKASKSFFNKFTDSIFNAPMVFFDSTPIGRILTRVSVFPFVSFFLMFFNNKQVLIGLIEVLIFSIRSC